MEDSVQICRAPPGARGLKSVVRMRALQGNSRRAPQGARGLKFNLALQMGQVLRRAPQGARGLKWKMGQRDVWGR